MAKLLRDGGYSYDQSKHLIAEARRRVGLTPPHRKKGSVDRLTREELEALRRAACLLSLRPLSIGRFERSSECEAGSIRKTTARSISSLISAQSAGTTLCSTGSTSSDQSWSRRETPELYRIRLHVSACYPSMRERELYLAAIAKVERYGSDQWIVGLSTAMVEMACWRARLPESTTA